MDLNDDWKLSKHEVIIPSTSVPSSSASLKLTLTEMHELLGEGRLVFFSGMTLGMLATVQGRPHAQV